MEAVVLHVALAVPLGICADVGLRADGRIAFIFAAASPWIVLAFSAGRASGLRWSAGVGALVILTGLGSYYAWLGIGQDVDSEVLFGRDYAGDLWLQGGAVIGGIAGLAGGLTRVRRQLVADLAWSGLATVPVGDCYVSVRYYTIGAWWLPTIFAACVLGAILWWAKRAGGRMALVVSATPLALAALIAFEIVALHTFHRLT